MQSTEVFSRGPHVASPTRKGPKNALLLSSALVLCGTLGCGSTPPRPALMGDHVVVQPEDGGDAVAIAFRDPSHRATLRTQGTHVALTLGQAGSKPVAFLPGPDGLAARSLETGEIVFRWFSLSGPSDRPVVADGRVWAPVDPRTARPEGPAGGWVGFELKNGFKELEIASDIGAPLAGNDDGLVTLLEGALVGYSTTDGKERWRSTKHAEAPLWSSGDWIIAKTDADEVGVFSASSGAHSKSIRLGGTRAFQGVNGPRPQAAASAGRWVWLEGGALHAVDLKSGTVTDHPQLSGELLDVRGQLAILATGDKVICADLLRVGAPPRWTANLPAEISSLAADDQSVALRTVDDALVVLDLRDGKSRFSVDLKAPPQRRLIAGRAGSRE